MITRADIDARDVPLYQSVANAANPTLVRRSLFVEVAGHGVELIDFWDGTGTGMCDGDPTMLRVRYPDTRECDIANDARVSLLPRGVLGR